MTENKSSRQVLNELKVEYAVKQKKGLPFIMASTVYCFAWKISRRDVTLKK